MEKIWTWTRDLLDEPSAESRHAALALLCCLAEGQPDCGVMRTIYFRFLRDTHAQQPPEDEAPRFRLLHALTNAGRNIECFEEEVRSAQG